MTNQVETDYFDDLEQDNSMAIQYDIYIQKIKKFLKNGSTPFNQEIDHLYS